MSQPDRQRSISATLSRRTAVIIAAMVLVGSGLTAAILEYSARTQMRDIGAMVAEEAAAQVASQFDRPIGVITSMRNAIIVARQQHQTERSFHDAIQRETLRATPQLLGTWTGWEPNAFDGRDADFVGSRGHDATGRYVPYWHRSGDAIEVEPLTDYDKPGPGDYYQLAFRSGKAVLIEPYVYKVGGKDVLMTSIALPVAEHGRSVGVVGGDLALDALQQRMTAIKVPYHGQISVLSGKRAYVFNADAALLGKPAGDAGSAISFADHPVLGSVLRVEVPVHFEGFEVPWTVRVDLPLTSVMAATRLIELALVLSALAMILGLAWLVHKTADRVIVAPLALLRGEMVQLAGGDLRPAGDWRAESTEIAEMQQALGVFRANALAKHSADAQQTAAVAGLGRCIEQLAAGDMTTRMEGHYSGEFERLQADFNQALTRLEGAMAGVDHSAADVATGSNEIRAASEDLSNRTERQAAGLEEVTAAVGMISARVQEAARSATEANTVAALSQQEVESSSAVIRRAIEAMGGIERSSSEITEIIGVIDGIAFQTNLLALNAGVEAARAGDAGKGFAVVASEVRALAQRSSEAAQDIKGRIAASSEQVQIGAALVGEMEVALERIVTRISQIGALAQTIARGTEEQSASVSEVSTTMRQIDSFTQQNAAMVEETTAAARHLTEQAQHLAGLMSQFRVSRPEGMASLPRARAA